MATSTDVPAAMRETASRPEQVPGEKTYLSTSMVDSTTRMLQSFKPFSNFSQHICTWAFYSQEPERKIRTHHYASRLNEDVLQCVVFDSPDANARIIGVEYVVSDKVFAQLPEEEKRLWHSHYHEIAEGLWVNPQVPETVSRSELKPLMRTYGKFWNTWQFDRGDRLPMGPPALMMSAQDRPAGCVPPAMITDRDRAFHISTAEKREQRASLADPEWLAAKEEAADWWMQSGKGWVTRMETVAMKGWDEEAGGMAGGERGGVKARATGTTLEEERGGAEEQKKAGSGGGVSSGILSSMGLGGVSTGAKEEGPLSSAGATGKGVEREKEREREKEKEREKGKGAHGAAEHLFAGRQGVAPTLGEGPLEDVPEEGETERLLGQK